MTKADILKAENEVRKGIAIIDKQLSDYLITDSFFWQRTGDKLTKLAIKAAIIRKHKLEQEVMKQTFEFDADVPLQWITVQLEDGKLLGYLNIDDAQHDFMELYNAADKANALQLSHGIYVLDNALFKAQQSPLFKQDKDNA